MVTLIQPEQTISKVIIQSPNIEEEIILDKVTLTLAQNANCDMELSDYFIYQKGYNDTALNVAYAGSGDYDLTLVSPLEESDDGT